MPGHIQRLTRGSLEDMTTYELANMKMRLNSAYDKLRIKIAYLHANSPNSIKHPASSQETRACLKIYKAARQAIDDER